MSKKKLGSLGKLSQFSGIKQKEETETVTVAEPPPQPKPQAKVKKKVATEKTDDKVVTVNIKVLKSQRDWLAERASQVRDNNLNPVPSKERVYPQHLIGVAIALLQSAEVDWEQVQDIEDLREQLGL